MSVADHTPTTGDRLAQGRFELLGKLGEGGMSLVFRARDHLLQREVALKLLQPRYVGRPEREQRLLNEAEYLRRLQGQPRIVEFIAAGRLDDLGGWPWLATEVLEGKTLNWLFVAGKLPVETILSIARQVAESLAACHRCGIVNRDTTPTNVMVIDRELPAIKLFDFSHAASLDAPRVAAGMPGRLTGVFDAPGSVGYMSPEQASKAPPDAQMDVFGFGALVYELVSREAPYAEFGDRDAFIHAQSQGSLEPLRLHAWAYGVPEGLGELVHACTRRSPGERPSMSEVVQRLDLLCRTLESGVQVEHTVEMDVADVVRMKTSGQGRLSDAVGSWRVPLASAAVVPPPAAVVRPEAPREPAPVLAFARPPEQRGAALMPAPAQLEQTPEPAAPEPPCASPDGERVAGSPARILVWLVVVAVVVLLAVLGWVYVSSSSATEQDKSVLPIPPSESNTDVQPSPEQPDTPGVTETGALEAEDDAVAETGGPSLVEPEPPAVEPVKPRAEPRKPHKPPAEAATPPVEADAASKCDGIEAKAEAAVRKRDWATVLELAGRTECWTSKRDRLRLEVNAYVSLGQWSKCIQAGGSSKDPEIEQLVATCKAAN